MPQKNIKWSEISHLVRHIRTLGSWISPKHSKILENVYSIVATFGSFLLWMVATVTTSQNSNRKKTPTGTYKRRNKWIPNSSRDDLIWRTSIGINIARNIEGSSSTSREDLSKPRAHNRTNGRTDAHTNTALAIPNPTRSSREKSKKRMRRNTYGKVNACWRYEQNRIEYPCVHRGSSVFSSILLLLCFVSRDANWQFVSIVVKLVRNRTLRKWRWEVYNSSSKVASSDGFRKHRSVWKMLQEACMQLRSWTSGIPSKLIMKQGFSGITKRRQ